MKRELFLVENLFRLDELLKKSSAENSSTIGVGLFSAFKLPEAVGSGVGLQVAPGFLRSKVLRQISSGHLSPLAQEVVLLGEAALPVAMDSLNSVSEHVAPVGSPVCRWLVAGVQPLRFGNNALPSDGKTSPWDFHGAEDVRDIVWIFLRAIDSFVLKLRASRVLFLASASLLQEFFARVAESLGILHGQLGREEIMVSMLAWFLEDCMHQSCLLVCERPEDFWFFVNNAKAIRRDTAARASVIFRT